MTYHQKMPRSPPIPAPRTSHDNVNRHPKITSRTCSRAYSW